MCFRRFQSWLYKKTPIIQELDDKLLDTSEIYIHNKPIIHTEIIHTKCCQKKMENQYSICPTCYTIEGYKHKQMSI
jgi:hypothetical protein